MQDLQSKIKNPQFYYDALLVGFFSFFLFSFQLGNRPFATPDEARYVEIPREMLATGDWITPRLNGVKYFEKPPFLYWLQAINLKIFGLQEGKMRLWIVFFATLGCIATYCFGQSVFNRSTGLIASGILATCCLYFSLARLIILDMPLSIQITLSLYCFYKGFYSLSSLQRRFWFYGFSTFCALGVLTKGIIALALSGPIIFLWLTWTRQWNRIFPLYIFSCLGIFLAIAAPWHILVSLKNPEFPYKYFIVEHFLRYTTTIHSRYQPFWFFIPILLTGLLPWTSFLFESLKNFYFQKKEPTLSFLWIWASWIFVFFSISHSKLIPYILSMFPPLALVIGHTLHHILDKNKNSYIFYHHSIFMVFLGLGGFVIPFYFPDIIDEKISLIPYILVLSSVFVGHGILVFMMAKRNHIQKMIYCIGSTALLIAIILCYASPYIQRPSLKSLAQMIAKERKDNEPIISFFTYFQDLPLYSQQIVTVAGSKGELEFGTTVENIQWIIDIEEFINYWQKSQKNNQKVWAVGRLNDIEFLKTQYPCFSYTVSKTDYPYIVFTP